jgi:antitoxin component of RelBE/YafQ-DinJ toxin-antitoxin module
MQITIRMPDEHYTQIEKIARQMGLKKSDITRLAIKQFIETNNIPQSAATPYAKTRHLLGSVESGIPDLGQNHRAHLIKKIKKA